MAEEADTVVYEVVEQEVVSSDNQQNQTDHTNEAVQLLVQAYEYGNPQSTTEANSDAVQLLVQAAEQQEEGQMISVDLQSANFSADGVQLLVEASQLDQLASMGEITVAPMIDGIHMLAEASEVQQVQMKEPENKIIDEYATFVCQVCSRTFISNVALQKHLQSHREKGVVVPPSTSGFPCDICEKLYLSKRAWLRHRQTVHMGIQWDTKKRDDKRSEATASTGSTGVDGEEEDGIEADRFFGNPDNETEENATAEDEAKKLEEELRIDKITAQARKDGFVLRCGECDRIYPSKWSLKRHMLLVHAPAQKESGEFSCTLCVKSFTQQEELVEHMKEQHLGRTHPAPKQPTEGEGEEAMVIDEGTPVESAPGEAVGEKATEGGTPAGAIDKTSPEDEAPQEDSDEEWMPGDASRFCCGLCNKSYSHKVNLKQHMVQCHFDATGIPKGKTDCRPRNVHCAVCDRKYLNIDGLRRHIKTVHGIDEEEMESASDRDSDLDDEVGGADDEKQVADDIGRVRDGRRAGEQLEGDKQQADARQAADVRQAADDRQAADGKQKVDGKKQADDKTNPEPQPGTSASYVENDRMEIMESDETSNKEEYLSGHGLKRHRPESEDGEPELKKAKLNVENYLQASPVVGDLTCSPCSKTFAHKWSLEKHLKSSVHKSALKEWREKGFAEPVTEKKVDADGGNESELSEEFVCAPCDKSFSSQYSLDRHLRSLIHKEVVGEDAKSSESETQVYTDTGEDVEKVAQNTDSEPKEFCCEPCGKSFSREFSLNRHLMSVLHKSPGTFLEIKEGGFECTVCGGFEASAKSLQGHLDSLLHKKAVAADGKSQSDDKDESFIQNEYGEYECSLCDKVYERIFSLKRHMESPLHKGKVADLASKVQVGDTSMKEEEDSMNQGEDEFRCYVCDTSFSSTHNLRRHYETRLHKETVKDGKKVKERESLGVRYEFFVRMKNGEFKCKDCDVTIKSSSHLNRHLETQTHKSNQKSRKAEGGEEGKEVEDDEAHEEEGEPIAPNEDGRYECVLCETSYSSSYHLKRHYDTQLHKDTVYEATLKRQQKTPMANTPSGDIGEKSTPKVEFPCRPCGKSFPFKYTYEQHLGSQAHKHKVRAEFERRLKSPGVELADEDLPGGQFVCEPCGTNFTSRKSLMRHFQSLIHKSKLEAAKKPFCITPTDSSAEKTPAERQVLKTVARDPVEKIPAEKAPEGGDMEKDPAKVISNEDPSMEEEYVGKFACVPCSSVFSCKRHLERHQATALHKSKIGKVRDDTIEEELCEFACYVCGKVYLEKQLLDEHLTTHTKEELAVGRKGSEGVGGGLDQPDVRGARVYPCGVCDKCFQHPKGWKRHMLKFHSGKEGPSVIATAEEGKKPHTDFCKFQCDLCDKSYRYRRGLNEHRQRVHKEGVCKDSDEDLVEDEEQDSLTCNVCDKAFPFQFSLERHLQRVHGIEQVYVEPSQIANLQESREKASTSQGSSFTEDAQQRSTRRPDQTLKEQEQTTEKKVVDSGDDEDPAKQDPQGRGEFPYDECDKVYPYERGLKRHKQTVHEMQEVDESPKAKTVELDGSRASSPVIALTGFDSFTKVGENRYPCGVCDKVLLSRTTWKRHRQSHEPEELEKFVMVTEMEGGHVEGSQEKGEAVDGAKPAKKVTPGPKEGRDVDESEDNFCKACNKSYPRRYALLRHMETQRHRIAQGLYLEKLQSGEIPAEEAGKATPSKKVKMPSKQVPEGVGKQEEEPKEHQLLEKHPTEENMYILRQGDGLDQNFVILQQESENGGQENVMIVVQSAPDGSTQETLTHGDQPMITQEEPQNVRDEEERGPETPMETEATSGDVAMESVEVAQGSGEVEKAAESLILQMAPDLDLSQIGELHIQIVPEEEADGNVSITSQSIQNMAVPTSTIDKTSKNLKGAFHCGICDKYYPWKWSLKRHMLQAHYVKEENGMLPDSISARRAVKAPLRYQCEECEASYSRKDNLRIHIERQHLNLMDKSGRTDAIGSGNQDSFEIIDPRNYPCIRCDEIFPTKGELEIHSCPKAPVMVKSSSIDEDKGLVESKGEEKEVPDVQKVEKKSNPPPKKATNTTVLCDLCAVCFPTTTSWEQHKCREQESDVALAVDRKFVAAEDFVTDEAAVPDEFVDQQQELEQLLPLSEGGQEDYDLDGNRLDFGGLNVMKTEDDGTEIRDSREKIPFLFACDYCDRWYPSQMTLHEHLQSSHNIEGAKPPPKFKRQQRYENDGEYACELCENRYRYKRGLVEHVKEHKCEFDKYIIEDQIKLASLKEPTEYLCDVCGIVSVSKDSLRHHLRSHEKEEQKQFLCEVCGLNCHTRREKKLHLKTHKDDKTDWKCDVCDKTFPVHRQRLIQTHIGSHTGDKPFECEICGKRLLRKCHLQSHLKRHESEKTIYVYECGECGKRFRQRSHLKVHIMSHNGEKPHECPDCGKRFLMHSHMKYHQKTVHAIVKPANFTCDLCGQLFVHKHHYKTHMMRHSGEKPYECDRCGKRFIQRSHLKTHIMTHTGEKPHECDHCGKRFLMSSHLKSHMISTHSSEKAFECGVCGKKCVTHGQFKSHMKVHAGLRGIPGRRYAVPAPKPATPPAPRWSNPLEVLSSIIVDSNNQYGAANIVPMSESNSHVQVEVLNSIQSIVPEQSNQVESQVEVASSALGESRHVEEREVTSASGSNVSVYQPGSGAKIDPSSCILIIPESGSQPTQQSGFRILPEMNSEDQPTSAILISHNVPRSSVTLEPSTMRGAYIISESDFEGEIDAASTISIAGGSGTSSLRIVREAAEQSSTVEVAPEIQMGQVGTPMDEEPSEQTTTIYVDEAGNPIDPATTLGYFPVQESGTYLASASQMETGSAINVVLEADPLDAKSGELTPEGSRLESGQNVVYVTEQEMDTKYVPPVPVTAGNDEESKSAVYASIQELERAASEEGRTIVYMEESEEAGNSEGMAQIVYMPDATPKTEPGAVTDSGAELEAAQAIIYVSESCGPVDQSSALVSESGQIVKMEEPELEKTG